MNCPTDWPTTHSVNVNAHPLFSNDRKIRRWLAAHQWPEIAAATVAAMLALWFLRCSGISDLDATARRALYQTLAGLSATLFGLTMTTISVLASSIDKPIGGSPKGLPTSLLRGLMKPMLGLLRALGALVLIALAMLVLDTNHPQPHWVTQPLILGCGFVVIVRVTRVLSLLSNLLKARSTPMN